jgi:hypothetical protein
MVYDLLALTLEDKEKMLVDAATNPAKLGIRFVERMPLDDM